MMCRTPSDVRLGLVTADRRLGGNFLGAFKARDRAPRHIPLRRARWSLAIAATAAFVLLAVTAPKAKDEHSGGDSGAPPAATATSTDYQPHDITSMAYILCEVRLGNDDITDLGGTKSEGEAILELAAPVIGENGERSNRQFSYRGSANGTVFVDWLIGLKKFTDRSYGSYGLAPGVSFQEPRNDVLLPKDPPHLDSVSANVFPCAFPGENLRWMGEWGRDSTYLRGDLVRATGRHYVAIRPNSEVEPAFNVTGVRRTQVATAWRPFDHHLVCSALSVKLAAELGDPEPMGPYKTALDAAMHQQALDREVNKLSGSAP
jgi:hypothetical protein